MPMFIVILFTIAKRRKQHVHPSMSDKENTAYTYNEISFSLKKEGNMSYAET